MRIKLQFFATVVCILGILLGFACKLWFPQYWFDLYIAILLVYWLIEFVMSFVVGRFEGHMNQSTLEGGRWMKIYMISKLVKVIITLGFIFVGLSFIDDNTHKIEFAGCSVAFYLINLGVETYIVTRKK